MKAQFKHSPHFSQQLVQRASTMRAELTRSEAALWRALSGRKLGVQFRRQVVVGRFIVDFFAPAVRLAVEVDGSWHRGRERADARRDRYLRERGLMVLRLPAELVLGDLQEAVGRVREVLGSI